MISREDIDAMAAQMVAEMAEITGAQTDGTPFDPGRKGAEEKRKPWRPLHHGEQIKAFNDQSDVVGVCGEKFTGKSVVCLDKIIAHCYTEFDALYTIIGNAHRALAEGVCHDLVTFLLPRWRDGNRVPMFDPVTMKENANAGELLDNGIGLEFTPWKADPNNKDLFLKIRNKYGGWSRIRVIAIPYAEMVQARVTNLNASGFYLEEATRCDGPDYYTWPSLQLYRRRGIVGPQQFLFSCNPDEPWNETDQNLSKAWVHKWMYKDSVVAKNQPGRDWPDDPEKPGIRRDKNVAFYYLHYTENKHNVSQKNRETLERTLRSDPIMRARLMESKWVAMPAGDSLFKAQYEELRHVRGETDDEKRKRNRTGIEPIPGYPIVIGMDWGSRNLGMVFKQVIDTEEGTLELTIDSLSYYQEMHKTRQLARAVLEKMRYWNEWLRLKRGWTPTEEDMLYAGDEERQAGIPSWCWWFITGDDATTNYNPESGSIHARDLQDHMAAILEEEPQRYLGIVAPIIRGCPRPKESVGKRTDIVAEGLLSDLHLISAVCDDVRGMFNHLPRDKEKPSHPAKGNRWIHIFDAYSYISYYRRFVLPGGFYNYNEGEAIKVS